MRAPHSHFKAILCCALLLSVLLGLSSGLGAVYYVSPAGVNTNSGSIGSPWKTIQKAASTAAAGDTVNIRAGIYAERVASFNSGNTTLGSITFQSYPGETAIIDGSTLTPTANQETALIRIDGSRSRLIFRDLEIRGYKNILANNASIAGIMILGTSSFIEFYHCKVHSIEGAAPANGSTNGIAIYGRNATAISNIIFDGCEVYNLKTRDSESFVANGNVDGFRISNCIVRDCDNIGIDIIGHEGTNSNPALDQARNGVIRGNHVYNIDSLLNPDYLDRTAGGIYVDGGRDLLIEQNRVHHCNIGIEIASENAGKTASNCIVRNNFVYLNELVGIYMGGSGAGNGGVTNCQFLHNTIFCNDTKKTGSGQIELQHHVSNVTFKHNLIFAGEFGSPKDLFRDRETGSTGIVLNYNLYWAPNGASQGAFAWQSDDKTGFTAWKTASGQDAQSLYVTPQLVNTASEATLDLHLLGTSPARNAGETTFLPQVGEVEIDGQTRVAESRVDIGADEFVPTVTIAGVDASAAEWLANTATFTLTRTAGNTVSAPLTVSLANSGTATDGIDFPTLLSATIPAGQNSTTLTLTPLSDALAEGPETAIWSIVDSPGQVVNGSVSPVTITIADRPLQQWKFTNFGINANTPSIAGDAVDVDQDGVPNIVEYAIGTNPLVRNPASPFTITTISPQLTATLTRPSKPVDVTLTGEISSNLTTWLGTPAIVETTNTATTYTFRDATPATANVKRFVRLRATP